MWPYGLHAMWPRSCLLYRLLASSFPESLFPEDTCVRGLVGNSVGSIMLKMIFPKPQIKPYIIAV